MRRSSLTMMIAAVILMGLVVSSEAFFGFGGKPMQCTWHNSLTRPFCGGAPKCSKGKKLIPGTEKKCGRNTLHCCATGNMMVCCPENWEGKAANAMAEAVNP